MSGGALLLGLAGCGGEDFESGDDTGSSSSTSIGGGSSGQGGTGGVAEECPAGSVCVAAPPPDWEGPVAFYVGEEPPDACPDVWTKQIDGNVGEPYAPHTCSVCACGQPTAVTCSFPTVTICSIGGTSTLLTSSACTDLGGGYSVKSTPTMAQGGSCLVSGGLADKSEAVWHDTAIMCGAPATSASCSSGVCAPIAEAPLRGPGCVHREGSFMCPDGFPDRTVVYRGFVDGRSCSDCACSAPTGASCEGALAIYSSDTCLVDGGKYVLPMDNQCHSFDYSAAAKFDPAAKGGSCMASGGEPNGVVENVEPVTVCCAD